MYFVRSNIFLFIAAMVLAGCGTQKVYKYKQCTVNCKPFTAPKIDDAVKEQYLNAINSVRSRGRSCGSSGYFSAAPALKWSDALYRSAYEHSYDMMKCTAFSHYGSKSSFDWTANAQSLCKGSSFKERIENNGYTKWKHIAENIERGSSTIDQVISRWVDSDKHCANMMNPIFTDVGMALVKGSTSRSSHYWTQDFTAHQ